ncbi:hypothetical protein EII34_06420 [Arachnia propionica]|uniref:Uncharacterized protein n=1 Tax=Arachnia propionica TaxID=1750 RepID=A0A3P1T850_9ACTN|nr:hypothetical protein [Arachnia propionica]RRD05365.1 hypothetical protein EII34_06420 [Arachnia propionica]
MPSEHADQYEVVIPENWKSDKDEYPDSPDFIAQRVSDVSSEAKFHLVHSPGGKSGLRSEGGDEIPRETSLEEELDRDMKSYADLGDSVKLVVLPEREIGGERAVGLRVRFIHGNSSWLREEWHVVRHDGVWGFRLTSGASRDVIGQDAYAILDSFRWIGPSPSPSAEESEE